MGQSQSDSFTPDITPLMLAAHRDNYEIIKILLERGDRIPKPHNVQCPCKECIAYSNDDILCHSRYVSMTCPYRIMNSIKLLANCTELPFSEQACSAPPLHHTDTKYKRQSYQTTTPPLHHADTKYKRQSYWTSTINQELINSRHWPRAGAVASEMRGLKKWSSSR